MTKKKFDISVITVCYNSISTIEKTIKSVISQSFNNYEYIIIDGGSTDGTIEVIEKYRSHINVFVSEQDNGIYDAFNKGVKHARGKYIGILSSDDTYNTNTLDLVSETIKSCHESVIYGDTCFIDEDDVVFGMNIGNFNSNNLKSGIGFMHPSSFIPKAVYDKIGLYSISKDLYIASDADFLIKCYKGDISFVKGEFKVFMRTGGLSETSFYTAHQQYLKSLNKNEIINDREFKLERFKLVFKGVLKFFFTRKSVAKIKLQTWIVLVAIFNFLQRNLLLDSLKNRLLKIFYFEIGKNSYVHNSIFLSLGKFKMGNHSVINPKCVLDNRGGIIIGDNVSIGHYSKIYTTGHDINCSYFTGIKKSVTIKDYVVLFSSCIIQPGVTIEEGAVVFPGAVVTKDIPAYSLVGGNPAKVIGDRNSNLNYKIDYGFKFIK